MTPNIIRQLAQVWCVLAVSSFPGPSLGQDAMALEDVKRRMADGWAMLWSLDNAECSYRIRAFEHRGGRKVGGEVPSTLSICRKPGFLKYQTDLGNSSAVCGFNPKYFFSVARRGQHRDFILRRVSLCDAMSRNSDIVASFFTDTMLWETCPLSCVDSLPGPELIGLPSFRLLKCVAAEGGCLQVSIKYDQVIAGGKPDVLPTYITLVLDPANYYVVRSVRYDPQMGRYQDIAFERVTEQADGRLICRRCELKQPSMQYVAHVEFSDYDFRTRRPDREFYLSHFGLPEPVAVTSHPGTNSWMLWLFAAGVCIVWAGMITRRLARKTPTHESS